MLALGKLIQARREDLGLSYTKLYKLANIDIRTLRAIEAGTHNLSLQRTFKLLQILKLDIKFSKID